MKLKYRDGSELLLDFHIRSCEKRGDVVKIIFAPVFLNRVGIIAHIIFHY